MWRVDEMILTDGSIEVWVEWESGRAIFNPRYRVGQVNPASRKAVRRLVHLREKARASCEKLNRRLQLAEQLVEGL